MRRFSWKTVVLVTVCLLLAGHPAHSQSKSEIKQAEKRFQKSLGLYQSGKFAEALDGFLFAQEIIPSSGNLYNIARCYQELGKYDEAISYFKEYIEQGGNKKDKARQYIEEIEKTPAIVEVRTLPEGATIWVDMQMEPAGASPLTIKLSPGKHTITAEVGGISFGHRVVFVDYGEHYTYTVKITKNKMWQGQGITDPTKPLAQIHPSVPTHVTLAPPKIPEPVDVVSPEIPKTHPPAIPEEMPKVSPVPPQPPGVEDFPMPEESDDYLAETMTTALVGDVADDIAKPEVMKLFDSYADLSFAGIEDADADLEIETTKRADLTNMLLAGVGLAIPIAFEEVQAFISVDLSWELVFARLFGLGAGLDIQVGNNGQLYSPYAFGAVRVDLPRGLSLFARVGIGAVIANAPRNSILDPEKRPADVLFTTSGGLAWSMGRMNLRLDVACFHLLPGAGGITASPSAQYVPRLVVGFTF